jgi:hypothetical protein
MLEHGPEPSDIDQSALVMSGAPDQPLALTAPFCFRLLVTRDITSALRDELLLTRAERARLRFGPDGPTT